MILAILLATGVAAPPVANANGLQPKSADVKVKSAAIDKEIADLVKMLDSITRRQESMSYMFDSRPRNIDRLIRELLGDELPQKKTIPKPPPPER
jgi:hypothetical protein